MLFLTGYARVWSKLKESMFIKWEKTDLNQHIKLSPCKELSVTHLILFYLVRNIDYAM